MPSIYQINQLNPLYGLIFFTKQKSNFILWKQIPYFNKPNPFISRVLVLRESPEIAKNSKIKE
jgi:hypothetical protein